jgi:hypothetical protein
VPPGVNPPAHVVARNLAQWNTDGNPNPEPYGFEPDAPWVADGGRLSDDSGSGTTIDPTSMNWPFAAGTSIRVRYDYATFTNDGTHAGAGMIYPNIKIGSNIIGGSPIGTKTDTERGRAHLSGDLSISDGGERRGRPARGQLHAY